MRSTSLVKPKPVYIMCTMIKSTIIFRVVRKLTTEVLPLQPSTLSPAPKLLQKCFKRHNNQFQTSDYPNTLIPYHFHRDLILWIGHGLRTLPRRLPRNQPGPLSTPSNLSAPLLLLLAPPLAHPVPQHWHHRCGFSKWYRTAPGQLFRWPGARARALECAFWWYRRVWGGQGGCGYV